MPRDSSGVYTLPDGYLATTGQTILASQHNPPLEDIASALTGALPRNGTSGMLANLPMGGFKAINMADGVAASDSATVGQVTGLISSSIAGAATKTTPIDADSLTLIDSAASNAIKRVTWANVKAVFQSASSVLTALAAIGTAAAGDVIYGNGAGTWGRLAGGTAGKALRMNSGATAPEWATVGPPDAVMEDQKSTGVGAQTLNSAASWITRDLNTEARDPSSLVSISSNQFTVTVAGWVEWDSPCLATNEHQSRLYNVTDSAVVAYGTSEHSDHAGTYATSSSKGNAAVVGGKTYRIEHRVSSNGSGGPGSGTGFAGNTEIYTRVKFWRT